MKIIDKDRAKIKAWKEIEVIYQKMMVPLRRVCRGSEDESPWGCIERLIEERDRLRNEVFEMTKSRDEWEYLWRLSTTYQAVLVNGITKLIKASLSNKEYLETKYLNQSSGKRLHDAIQLRLEKGHHENCWFSVSGADKGECDCGHQALVDALKGA